MGHADFSVVVKSGAALPNAWHWEIYRAGRASPILKSEVNFALAIQAYRAGRAALGLLLSEYQS